MAKFVATVQTAMFFAASGSTRTCVDAREHASSSAAELLWEHGGECEDSTEQTAQDDNLVDEDEAEQWSISEGQSVLYVILNTRREDIVPADELDMSDDENEETNFTTFRAFLSFSKVALHLVSSDTMDRITMERDEDEDAARLSVLGRR